MQFPQLAKIALEMLNNVNVPANDQALGAAMSVRQMLHGINTGQLVVGTPEADTRKDTVAELRPGKAP